MSSANHRTTPWAALLASGLIASVCSGGALAQSTAGGLSSVVPTLRGGVDEPDAPASPDPAEPDPARQAGDGAPPQSTATEAPAQPPIKAANRPALAKSPAKTQNRVKVPRAGPPPLPPLQSYPTALRPRTAVPIADTNATSLPAPTTAALPITIRPKPRVEEDLYAAQGLRAGPMIVTPYVFEGLGYDSNPDQTQGKVKGSGFSRTEGGVGLAGTWEVTTLRADLRGGYNDYFSDAGANRPDAHGTVNVTVDVLRDFTLDGEQRFAIDTQRPGSPDVSVNTVSRPLITSFGETLGATETLGRVSLGVHGSFDRVAYDNALLSNGIVQDLANANYNDYGVRLRAGYEITPVVKPFVDVLVDQRVHDATVDLSGFRRDSVGVIGQAGSTFEFNRLFSGELSAGYGNRTFDDRRLKDLDGPVVNGSLSYAVTPLTNLSLLAATTFDETTVPGSSGAQSQSLTFTATHQLLRNLTLTGAVSYLDTDYTGVSITETTWAETLKADYHLSRLLVATAAYNHQTLHSTAAGSSFSQDVVLFGLRLQK